MPAASLRALLSGVFDYAGLFPPAELGIGEALTAYSTYVRSDDVWMLGPFILPLKRFEVASANLTPFDVETRLRISALCAKPESPSDVTKAVESATTAIRSFNAAWGATASIEQLEVPIPPGVSAGGFVQIRELIGDLKIPAFFESPVDEAEGAIATLADTQMSPAGDSTAFGFKLRTGGVIASAFPSPVQTARALVAAARQKVPIKFTAGLHHPIRGFQPSVQTIMHGFLNVFGAGVLALEHEWDVQQAKAMLEDENVESFDFTDSAFTWRDWSISTEQISAHRALITSVGSCSFDEPREDLRALGLL